MAQCRAIPGARVVKTRDILKKGGGHRFSARVPRNTRHYIGTAANDPRHLLPQRPSARLACTRLASGCKRSRLARTQQEVAPCSHEKFCSTASYSLHKSTASRRNARVGTLNAAPTHPRCVTPILPTLALPDAALYRNGGGWFPQPVGHKGETPCSNVSGCTPLDGTAAKPETGIGVCGAKRAELAQNSCTLRLPHPARRGFILATLYHISACTQEFAYFVIATA